MNCPNCDAQKIQVEETRTTRFVIWRVRCCHHCGWRVTTKEVYAPADQQAIPRAIRKPHEKRNKK